MRKHSPMSMFFKSVSEVVDQEQLVHNDTGYIGNAAGVTVFGAQSFKLSGEKTFTAIEGWCPGIGGSFSGDATTTIETDDSGKPSGILVNVNATKTWTPVVGIVKTIFDVPFVLSGGTTYWIVIRCGAQTMGNYGLNMINNKGGYANGHMSAYYMGSWHDAPTSSLYFKLYVQA